MDEQDFLTERFEEHRTRLRAVAYRMLGSVSEADDAVQDAWLRLSRADTSGVENLAGWLTTVVARVCLNMLRARAHRQEEPLDVRVPDPIISPESGADPEQEAVLADSVGLALLVVLETLTPAERLAFVLHDMFAVPFEEIAPMIERSPAAARQLASRARRRVRGQAPDARPGPEPASGRSSTRSSPPPATATSTRWSRCSHPDVVLRSDGGLTRARHSVVLHRRDGRWPGRRSPSGGSPRSRVPRWSTVPPASWSWRRAGRCR